MAGRRIHGRRPDDGVGTAPLKGPGWREYPDLAEYVARGEAAPRSGAPFEAQLAAFTVMLEPLEPEPPIPDEWKQGSSPAWPVSAPAGPESARVCQGRFCATIGNATAAMIGYHPHIRSPPPKPAVEQDIAPA